MTDSRDRRVAALTAAAKAKSQKKIHAAEDAIRRLVKRGEPITFQAVQREAGVSHAFLYNHPELRGRIEHLRNRSHPASIAETTVDGTLVTALSRQVADLKKRHHRQLQALREALERAHGENLALRRELARRGGDAASIASTI